MGIIGLHVCLLIILVSFQGFSSYGASVASNGDSQTTTQGLLRSDQPARVAGYISLEGTVGSQMFYMFFENRGGFQKAPIAFWLNGGPGCSSLYGLFYLKMGPYDLDEETLKWCENEFGWDRSLSMVFVDQPINVGFSYSTHREDWVDTQERLADDMLQFLLGFLRRYPEVQERELYLTGESYAGSMIPVIAARILDHNSEKPYQAINLVGITMANGMTVPQVQYLAYKEYGLMESLIDYGIYQKIQSLEPICLQKASNCQGTLEKGICADAYDFCQANTFGVVYGNNPGINYYDIRQLGLYDPSAMVLLLNQQCVRAELGIPAEAGLYDYANWDVLAGFSHDMMRTEDDRVAKVLAAGVRVLVYAGDKDLKCNWLGNKWWVDALEWEGHGAWSQAPEQVWGPIDSPWGVGKEARGLTYLRVYDAGHAVGLDQPYRSLALIHAFTRNKSVFSVDALRVPGVEYHPDQDMLVS